MFKKVIVAAAVAAVAVPGVAQAADGPWNFVNGLEASGGLRRAMEVDPDTVSQNGSRVYGWERDSAALEQKWYRTGNTIRPLHDQSMCLDANPNENWDGGTVYVWACNGSRQQQWLNGPNNSLVNDFSRRCLDADPRGAVNGGRIYQWSCNNTKQQQWFLFGAPL